MGGYRVSHSRLLSRDSASMNATRRPASLVEQAFAVGVLMLSTNAVLPLLAIGGGGVVGASESADSGIAVAIWLPIYFVTAVLLLLRRRSFYYVAAVAGLLGLLSSLALLSVLWSVDPSLTLRRSVALVCTFAFGLYLRVTFDTRTILRILALATGLVVVSSIAVALAIPSYGLDPIRQEAWRGLFTTKNELGRIAALSTILWATCFAFKVTSRRIAALLVLASLAAVLGSNSRTALTVVAAMAVVALAIPIIRAGGIAAVAAGTGMLAVGIIAAYGLLATPGSGVLDVSGDPTLQGRTQLWGAVWDMIGRHPLLGYGYSAFWNGAAGPSAEVWSTVRWAAPHSHNGLLDVALDLGAVGVGLVVAIIFQVLHRSVRKIYRAGTASAVIQLLLVCFLVLYNVTESGLVARNSLFGILLALAVAIGREEERIVVPTSDQSSRLPQALARRPVNAAEFS